jgi:ABC-type nitrate/sulfonate/bicarbonate transport system substrate-binding protein
MPILCGFILSSFAVAAAATKLRLRTMQIDTKKVRSFSLPAALAMACPAVLAAVWIMVFAASAAEFPGKTSTTAGRAKIRIAIPAPSLSFLPIQVAMRQGFYAQRGMDVEMIQMAAGLAVPALLSGSVDYTTILSGPATASARGAPLKAFLFTSVKLQHFLISRPEIVKVEDLAGKKIGSGALGTLPAYQVRVIIEKYRLGPNTTIVPVPSSTERLLGTQKGTIDAGIVPAPMDLKAEELGLRRLLHVGSILQIPQAGLASTEEKLRTNRREVIEIAKATIEGLEFTSTQVGPTIGIIARWMNLNAVQAARTYETVRDTYSRNGLPTDEQVNAYITMLASTAGIKEKIAPASIYDFSPTEAAIRELADKK